jgi:hypothetical protein
VSLEILTELKEVVAELNGKVYLPKNLLCANEVHIIFYGENYIIEDRLCLNIDLSEEEFGVSIKSNLNKKPTSFSNYVFSLVGHIENYFNKTLILKPITARYYFTAEAGIKLKKGYAR